MYLTFFLHTSWVELHHGYYSHCHSLKLDVFLALNHIYNLKDSTIPIFCWMQISKFSIHRSPFSFQMVSSGFIHICPIEWKPDAPDLHNRLHLSTNHLDDHCFWFGGSGTWRVLLTLRWVHCQSIAPMLLFILWNCFQILAGIKATQLTKHPTLNSPFQPQLHSPSNLLPLR